MRYMFGGSTLKVTASLPRSHVSKDESHIMKVCEWAHFTPKNLLALVSRFSEAHCLCPFSVRFTVCVSSNKSLGQKFERKWKKKCLNRQVADDTRQRTASTEDNVTGVNIDTTKYYTTAPDKGILFCPAQPYSLARSTLLARDILFTTTETRTELCVLLHTEQPNWLRKMAEERRGEEEYSKVCFVSLWLGQSHCCCCFTLVCNVPVGARSLWTCVAFRCLSGKRH